MSTSSTVSQLPLKPPSVAEEEKEFRERVADMEAFFKRPRFASLSRPYTAVDIVAKQGSMPVLPLPSTLTADKLYKLFTEAANEKRPVHTIGVVDPIQMTQLAPHSEAVYISGWMCSNTLTTGFNDVGPDLGWAILVYPRVSESLTFFNEGITHIPRFPTKSNGSSRPNNCTTRNTMTPG